MTEEDQKKPMDPGVLANKTNLFVLWGNLQPWSDPPIVRMARWPKTAGELGKCIGAESVRTTRQEKVLCCVVCTAGAFIG